MPRLPSTIPLWQRELLRLGRRRFLRGRTGDGSLALGGFGSHEPALAGVPRPPPDGFDRVVSIMDYRRRRPRPVDESSSTDE
jgi:hypothetical protein